MHDLAESRRREGPFLMKGNEQFSDASSYSGHSSGERAKLFSPEGSGTFYGHKITPGFSRGIKWCQTAVAIDAAKHTCFFWRSNVSYSRCLL